MLSINQAAEEFGRDRATITRGVNRFALVPAGDRGGFPVYRLRDLMQIERKDADGAIDPDKLTAFERQAHFRAESERMRLDVERGRLIKAEDVETEWARVLKMIAQELDVIVDECERDVGASPAVLEKIEAKLDLIRERMFGRVATPETSDAAGAVPSSQ